MRWSFVLLALGIVARSRVASAKTLPELAEEVKPSVVLLSVTTTGGSKGSGTGFVVSSTGIVVTNHHVIASARSVTATFADGVQVPVAGIAADDEDADIALLKLDRGGFPVLPLGEGKTVRAGDEVVVIGSPLGLSASITAGIVSAVRTEGPAAEVLEREKDKLRSWSIQISAPISPGSSGSPVLTRDGSVVAVAVGNLVGAQSVNFAVPIEVAKAHLAKLGPEPKIRAFRSPSDELWKNLAISVATVAALALAIVFGTRSTDVARRAKGRAK
jgi:S1-C subfamily serine protease